MKIMVLLFCFIMILIVPVVDMIMMNIMWRSYCNGKKDSEIKPHIKYMMLAEVVIVWVIVLAFMAYIVIHAMM